MVCVTLTGKQYYGKVCIKHPELNGLRARPHYRCIECFNTYQREYASTKRKRAKEVLAQCKQIDQQQFKELME